MIRVSVLYPKTEGATFNHDYYRTTHVPLCETIWEIKGSQIDKGIDGPNVAAVHFFFDSMDAMQAAMAKPGMADVMGDVANYTTITPVMQVAEVVQ